MSTNNQLKGHSKGPARDVDGLDQEVIVEPEVGQFQKQLGGKLS